MEKEKLEDIQWAVFCPHESKLPIIPTCEKLEAAAYWKSVSPRSFFKYSIDFWIWLPSLHLYSYLQTLWAVEFRPV